jgi:hypothetical protein
VRWKQQTPFPHFHFTWCVTPDIALVCIMSTVLPRHCSTDVFIFSYKHNPWRAPGFAPVGDACGLAGGTPWGAEVGEAGDYTNTTYAHHGMNGTTLPPMDTGVVWTIGLEAEVTWQVGVAGRLSSACLPACLSAWVCVLSVCCVKSAPVLRTVLFVNARVAFRMPVCACACKLSDTSPTRTSADTPSHT